MKEIIGQVIKDTYRVDSFLGEGGPSVVYLGRDLLLDVPVAIKRLKPMAAMGQSGPLAERFLREGRTQARLVHQNIVGVRAVLEEQGDYFIVMEFVEGSDLGRILAELPRQQMPLQELSSIFCQVCEGLGYAHEHDVVHRDIKPSNIMVTPQLRVKIADFGIARVVTDSRLTQTGYLVGTVAYMSPEQLKGRKLDNRADIYSLGVALFECVAGCHPFRIDNEEEEISNFELMSRHIYGEVPSILKYRDDLPLALDEVVRRTLAKEPEARYPDCAALAEALKQALSGVSQDGDKLSMQDLPALQRNTLHDLEASKALTAALERSLEEGTGAYARSEAKDEGTGAYARSEPAQPGGESTGAYARSEAKDEGTGAYARSEPAAAQGTGVFDREERSSEERPSGALVSVSTPRPQEPIDAPKPAPEHHELESKARSAAQSGGFFREESEGSAAQGTGVFDRDVHGASKPPQAQEPPPAQGTGVFDRESPAVQEPAKDAQAPDEAPLQASEAPGPSRARFPLALFLLAGLLVGGGVVWKFAPTNPAPGSGGLAVDGSVGSRRDPPRSLRSRRDAMDAGAPSPRTSRQSPPAPAPRPANPTPARPIDPGPMAKAAGRCPAGMVFVKGGFYLQGDPKQGKNSDRPQRRVYISSFCIERHEVAGHEYRRCIQQGPCAKSRRRIPSYYPARWVSWEQAGVYCRWMSRRLPTEAEWEYAARAHTQTRYPWGPTPPTCSQAISKSCRSKQGPRTRSNTERGFRGIHDMLGNVWEWVRDCYHPKAYSRTANKDPIFDQLRCRKRVARGGSYRSSRSSEVLSPTYRRPLKPRGYVHVGFRCASPPLTSAPKPREL